MELSKKYEECLNPFVIYKSEVDLVTGEYEQNSFEKRVEHGAKIDALLVLKFGKMMPTSR